MSGKTVDMKVVLLGKEFGGKTSLSELFIYGRFADTLPYQNTIGAAFGAKRMENKNKKFTMGIWDTAGSERYEAMSRIYYRGAWAAVVCYALNDKTSFDRVRFWVDELKKHEPSCKVYLCGTKYDLVDGSNRKNRAVDYHMTTDFADEINAFVIETSSKSGHNVDKLFEKIAEDYIDELIQKEAQLRDQNATDLPAGIILTDNSHRSNRSRSGCCGGGNSSRR